VSTPSSQKNSPNAVPRASASGAAATARRALIWMLILLSWEAAFRLVGWRAWIFPAPSHVIDSAASMLGFSTHFGEPLRAGWPLAPQSAASVQNANGEQARRLNGDASGAIVSILRSPMVQANLVSALRLLAGFALSVLAGGVLGAAMWRFRELDRLLGPLFLGMQTLPSVCWVPLAIILFGLRETGILFVLVMGSVFAIAIALRDGLRTIPPLYERAGQMLGARGWRLYRYVLLPASLPAVAGSLRQGFSFAWRSLMGAEVIFAVQNHGLGWLLQTGRDYNDVAQVVAVMGVMIAIGMLCDRFAFAQIERAVHTRFGLAT
jgi:NitT/TauT family transport system permease protein